MSYISEPKFILMYGADQSDIALKYFKNWNTLFFKFFFIYFY